MIKTSKPTWRNWVNAGVPAVALAGALVAALLSLGKVSEQANIIEARVTARTVEAAMAAFTRRVGETNADYAVWDDAVRALYGDLDNEFINQNYISSTSTATFFDTVYLLDESGRDVFAYRNGEPLSIASLEAFGPGIQVLVDESRASSEPETGIAETPWGLAAVAVGPIIPNTEALPIPRKPRLLIIAKALDTTTLQRLAEDYVIADLRIAGPKQTGVPLVDPTGSILGTLEWNSADLGGKARSEAAPFIVLTFTMLFVVVGGMSLLVVRTVRQSERLSAHGLLQQQRLDAALTSVTQGICMFDGQRCLVFSNARYAQMYNLPPNLVAPGTPLKEIVEYRRSAGNAPIDVPFYISHEGLDKTAGKTLIFEFKLGDGRIVRINHLNMPGGSYVASHEDITELIRAEDRVAEAATIDILTNTPNRTAFRRALADALGNLSAGQRVCVTSLDLDRFTDVNEVFGHKIGDALLVKVADRLRNAARDCYIARVGGDQFALVQTDRDQPESGRKLAQAILDAFHTPFELDGSNLAVTASIGIALAPDHGRDPDQLLKNAEMAEQWVKSHRRGSYQFFDPAMSAASETHHQIAAGLQQALQRQELEIHYQPILNLASDSITGFEALLRWRHPHRGYISPAEFIPIAEETGIITEIGAWALSTACLEAARWPRELHVAVNLSSLQFRDPNLLQIVFKALANSGLRPGRLELEITESVLLSDTTNTLAVMHKLREFGVRIAMDDFGTGYSSLSYLRSFPFDKIKIDQSFVQDMMDNSQSLAIVRAIISLAKEFALVTTAEGVETEEQLSLLRSAGCDEVQGFLISAARPRGEIADFTQNKKISRIRAA